MSPPIMEHFARKAHAVNIRDYLKIKAAAELLGVSVNTLRNWERSEKIRTYRHPINGYRLYKKAELETLLTTIEQSAERSDKEA